MKQKVVIIRGTSCSGKTTISEELRDYDNKIAWLSIDNIKRIFSNFQDSALDDVNQTAVITLHNLLDRGFSVVVEGIFKKPEHIQNVIAVGNNKNLPVIIYQLDCSLETLKNRDKTRKGIKEGWFSPLGDELIESLFRKVEENPIENAIYIDTESVSPKDIVEIIKKNFE